MLFFGNEIVQIDVGDIRHSFKIFIIYFDTKTQIL